MIKQPKTFYDFLGTKIEKDDVLFSGGRDNTHGRATLLIVTHFTASSICGDVLNSNTIGTLKFKKGALREGKFCIVTGMTREDVMQRIQINKEVMPKNLVTSPVAYLREIDFKTGIPKLEYETREYFMQEYVATWPEANHDH